jgi:DNA-binding XRE family transcriptional regulator
MAFKAKTISLRVVGERESLAHMAKHRSDLHAGTKRPSTKYFLGVNLCRLRREKSLSQAQLAKRAKISLRSVAYIESASPDSNPGLDMIDALAWALGVSVAQLLEARPADVLVI